MFVTVTADSISWSGEGITGSVVHKPGTPSPDFHELAPLAHKCAAGVKSEKRVGSADLMKIAEAIAKVGLPVSMKRTITR